MCWLPPRSPYGLIQEDLFPDKWMILVTSVMLNRTSRKQVEKVLRQFAKLWPDAKSLSLANVCEIAVVLKALGLSNRRATTLLALARAYIADKNLCVSELPGIGAYATRAWEIFCEGRLGDLEPKDHALAEYWRYCKQHNYMRTRQKDEQCK